MLHVFSVTAGHMMTFDVALAMDRVAELKQAIASTNSSVADKQVLLINGGQALENEHKVCTYTAGTETNPIYVFDKSMIERPALTSSQPSITNSDFSEEIKSALQLSPSYATVITRTQLAIQVHEKTHQQVARMKTLVHDEHLMFQGWQAAIANLSDTVNGFENRMQTMREQCLALLEKTPKFPLVLEGLDEVLLRLATIPLLQSMQGEQSSEITLLDWIEEKCKKVPLVTLLSECRQRCQLLTKEKFDQLYHDCGKVSDQAHNIRMQEIAGIGERLVALDQVIIAAKQHVKEQKGIAQGFMKNQERAKELQESEINRDTLLTFCESHINQLQIMCENESAIREAMMKCDAAKTELAQNLHTRLRWLYFVQRSILNADVKVSMFREQLSQLHHKVEFLSQVKRAPSIYFQYLVECIRRKTFSQTFIQWSNQVLTTSKVTRDKEVGRRKQFKSHIGNHFVQQLFPGFSDRPPLMAKRPLREFDLELPNVTPSEISQFDLSEFSSSIDGTALDNLLADPGQASWQLVCSTSVQATTTISLQNNTQLKSNTFSASLPCNSSLMSLSTSVIDKQQPTELNDNIYDCLKHETHFQPGGFVVTSVQNMVGDDREDLKNFSPPHLIPPNPGELLEIGSPDSGEFYSLKPFSLSPLDIHDASFNGDNMRAIPEDVTSSFTSEKSNVQGSVVASSEEDEMFHSFTNESEKEKLMIKLKRTEEEKESQGLEFKSLISKLENQVVSVEKSREDIVTEFERRWSESRAELDHVISQLESEQRERKQAWQNESLTHKEVEELKSKCAILLEQNAGLKSDLTNKVQLMTEIDAEVRKRQDSIQIEMAHVQENAEREIWRVKQESNDEKDNLTKTVESLERDIELKDSQLLEADNRVQELESEISDIESKLVETNTNLEQKTLEFDKFMKHLDDVKLAQSIAEDNYLTQQKHFEELNVKLNRSEEKCEDLKRLMAAYEVELNQSRENEVHLKEVRGLLGQEKFKNEQFSTELDDARTRILKFEEQVETINLQLNANEKQLAEANASLVDSSKKIESEYQAKIIDMKTKEAELIKNLKEERDLLEQNVNSDHQAEVQRLKDQFNAQLEELRQNNLRDLDEMEADRLDAVIHAQRKVDEMQTECEKQTAFHQSAVEQLKIAHLNELTRLQQQVEQLTEENVKLSSNIRDIKSQQGSYGMMTSSLISSNEEMETKRTKMDNNPLDMASLQSGSLSPMMISVTDHQMSLEHVRKEHETQKKALQTSFKKKEEDSTRRRQMVFNSAIMRVTAAKDAEIIRLKERLSLAAQTGVASSHIVTQDDASESVSSQKIRDRERVVVSNFQLDDPVLIIYDPQYSHHVVLSTGHTLHFVHSDSMADLGLQQSGFGKDTQKNCIIGMFVEKEYCQAKKASNRFKVPVGSKFYRVKLKPYKKVASGNST